MSLGPRPLKARLRTGLERLTYRLARRLAGEHGCFALAIDGPVHGRRFVAASVRGNR